MAFVAPRLIEAGDMERILANVESHRGIVRDGRQLL
jgi:hypothetical protein